MNRTLPLSDTTYTLDDPTYTVTTKHGSTFTFTDFTERGEWVFGYTENEKHHYIRITEIEAITVSFS